jgi:hypothetical protein
LVVVVVVVGSVGGAVKGASNSVARHLLDIAIHARDNSTIKFQIKGV